MGAGYPRDAAAVLLVEVDGLAGGVAEQVDAVARDRARARRAHGAGRGRRSRARAALEGPQVGVRRHRPHRARLLPARRGGAAHQARRRAAPGVRDRRRAAAHDDERVPRRRRQPAPADRVRPRASPACGSASTRPATRSSPRASPPGGVLSGEHGIGLEKREAMPLHVLAPTTSTPRPACATRSIPSGARQPAEDPAAREPVRRAAARARRARGSERVDTAIDELARGVADAERWSPVGCADPLGGRWPAAAGARRGARARRRGRSTTPPTSPSPSARHPCAELAEVLGERGQECALDPRDRAATVGGVLATGLSGHRRLRSDRSATACSRCGSSPPTAGWSRPGGPTVKNVSGFDLPRLLVGSLGTIGVLVQVTLRCQPRPASSEWFTTDVDPFSLRRALYRPSCLAWDGATTQVLLEGVAGRRRCRARAARRAGRTQRRHRCGPTGAHRGRVSVRPSALPRARARPRSTAGVRWLAEVGVGTVHVAGDDAAALARARGAAEAAGGWLLREAGAPRPRRLRPRRCRTRGCAAASGPRSTPPASARPAASLPTPADG